VAGRALQALHREKVEEEDKIDILPATKILYEGWIMLEALRKRRSVRKYSSGEVPEEDIREVLKAAMVAPSAWGKRPWHFIVVREQRLKEKLSRATPYASHAADAPVVFVLAADMELARRWVEDLSIAAAQMMVQGSALGYGTCFIQIRDDENDEAEDYVRELLSIPRGYRVECMLALGKPGEEKGAHSEKEFQEERVHWEEW